MTKERIPDGELESFRQEFKSFIATHAPERLAREGHRSPVGPEEEAELRCWFRELFDAGYIGASWPVEYGGRADYQPLFDRIVLEEILRARAPRPIDQVNLAAHLVIRFGTATQKARYLPKIRSSEEVWCQLLSEPD